MIFSGISLEVLWLTRRTVEKIDMVVYLVTSVSVTKNSVCVTKHNQIFIMAVTFAVPCNYRAVLCGLLPNF